MSTNNQENKKPTHVILNEIRDKISDLRHELYMVGWDDKLWNESLQPCVGGLTCVISTLYHSIEEIENHHNKWIKNK